MHYVKLQLVIMTMYTDSRNYIARAKTSPRQCLQFFLTKMQFPTSLNYRATRSSTFPLYLLCCDCILNVCCGLLGVSWTNCGCECNARSSVAVKWCSSRPVRRRPRRSAAGPSPTGFPRYDAAGGAGATSPHPPTTGHWAGARTAPNHAARPDPPGILPLYPNWSVIVLHRLTHFELK